MNKFKLRYLLIFIFIWLNKDSRLYAQPGSGISFNFSTAAGATTLPSFTSIAIGASPTAQDDTAFRVSPAGMNVRFQGRQYTSFVISTNGWAALLPAATPAGVPATLS